MSDYDPAQDTREGYEVGITEIRRRKIAAGEIVPWVRREVIGDGEVVLIGFERRACVYLVQSADGEPKYVGSTSQSIWLRIRGHINDAKNGSDLPVHVWMRSVDFRFVVEKLDDVPEARRVDAERSWVASFGGRLLNVTDGGPGMSGHKLSNSHAEGIARQLRRGDKFVCHSCGASFWRKPRDIKRGHNKFCSRSCYSTSLRGVSRPMPAGVAEAGVEAAAVRRRKITHCCRGHEFTEANTYINRRGARICRSCRKEDKASYLRRLANVS